VTDTANAYFARAYENILADTRENPERLNCHIVLLFFLL
jgi:hypothetical protein